MGRLREWTFTAIVFVVCLFIGVVDSLILLSFKSYLNPEWHGNF